MAKMDKKFTKTITHCCFGLLLLSSACTIDDSNNYEIDLGAGYTYYHYDKSQIRYSDPGCNGIDIPPQIEQCKYGKRFILVRQRPNTYSYRYSSYKGLENGCYKMGIDTPYYWIIDKQEQIHFGPISYDEYQHISDSLNIPVLLEK